MNPTVVTNTVCPSWEFQNEIESTARKIALKLEELGDLWDQMAEIQMRGTSTHAVFTAVGKARSCNVEARKIVDRYI